MRVAEIWRYPVKSMAGERLDEALLTPAGIPGDRIVHVRLGGRIITSRTHPRLLGFKARLGPDGEPLVGERCWDAPETAAALRAALAGDARLARSEEPERFDVLPLLVATDGAISALGHDRRRLRPNILVEGVEGLAERQWPGRRLRIGDAVVGLRKLRSRCVMTTFDPDTLEQDLSVLRRIARQFAGRMALDSEVIQGGPIHVGDPVELI